MKCGYVVRFKEGTDAQALADEYEQLGANVISVMPYLRFISLEMEPELVHLAGEDTRIETVGFDSIGEIRSLTTTQTDLTVVREGYWSGNTGSSEVTGQLDGRSFDAWGLNRLSQVELPLDGTYKYSTTAQGVRAYIVDTGVNPHIEFGWTAPGANGRLVEGTTTWRTGDWGDAETGSDFLVNGRSSIVESAPHGGTCAGIVGGTKVGLAKSVTVVAVKYGDWYQPTVSVLLEMFEWIIADKLASGQPAVANFSWGWYNPAGIEDVEAAFLSLKSYGIAIICAGGNLRENGNNTATPQRLNGMPHIVAVGAACSAHGGIEGRVGAYANSDPISRKRYEASNGGYDRIDLYSAYGLGVDIYAPANVAVNATTPDAQDIYNNSNLGTSFAAPHVTGIAALIYAENPTWTAQQVMEEVIARAATDVLIVDPAIHPNVKNRLAQTGVNLWGVTSLASASGTSWTDTSVSLPADLTKATGNWYRYRISDTSAPVRNLVDPLYSDWVTVGVVINNAGVQVDDSLGLLMVNDDETGVMQSLSVTYSASTGTLEVIPNQVLSDWSAYVSATTLGQVLSDWSAYVSATTSGAELQLAGTSGTLTYSVATLSVENISSSYAAYAGTVLVSEIRIGTTPVVAVYQGSTRVW